MEVQQELRGLVVLKVGLHEPFWCAKYAVPLMIAGGQGGRYRIDGLLGRAGMKRGLPLRRAPRPS